MGVESGYLLVGDRADRVPSGGHSYLRLCGEGGVLSSVPDSSAHRREPADRERRAFAGLPELQEPAGGEECPGNVGQAKSAAARGRPVERSEGAGTSAPVPAQWPGAVSAARFTFGVTCAHEASGTCPACAFHGPAAPLKGPNGRRRPSRREGLIGRPRVQVGRSEQQAVVERFLAALRTGRLQELLDVMAPDAVLIADGGGGLAAAAPAPIHGGRTRGEDARSPGPGRVGRVAQRRACGRIEIDGGWRGQSRGGERESHPDPCDGKPAETDAAR